MGLTGLACGLFLTVLMGSPAPADEIGRSTLAAGASHPARCDAAGGDCRRISGYVTAGAGFQPAAQRGAVPAPFGPLDAPEFVGAIRAAGAALIRAPAAGLDRIFAAPPSGAEAR